MSLVERLAGAVSNRNRRRKFSHFLETLSPAPEDSILDVGVNAIEYSENDNFLEKHYSRPETITAVSLDDLSTFQERYPKVRAVRADGRKLPFPDNSFSFVHSNAVIEHVGGREDQQAFLSELYRVSAKGGFLTTPNRRFPIEVHTRLALLHLFLPKRAFDGVLRMIGKSWAAGDYMHLLSKGDLKKLASGTGMTDYEITAERFLGWPLTYTLIWHKQ